VDTPTKWTGDSTRGVSLKGADKPAAERPSTLLIVDDEQDILDSLDLVIQTRLPGVEVITTLSGAAALDVMRQQKVGAILTDYKMPKMDGFQFVTEARKIDPHVPVVMMTAYPDPGLASKAQRDYGIGLLMAKPFDMRYMVEILRLALAGKPLAGSGKPQVS
jgi:DNA-binding NtrC family response regulator